MPIIKIRTENVHGFTWSLNSVKIKNSEAVSKVRKTKANLDWQVQAKSSISSRLNNIQRRLDTQEDKIDAIRRAVETAASSFETKDKRLSADAKMLLYKMKVCKILDAIRPKPKPTASQIFKDLIKVVDINSVFKILPPADEPIALGIVSMISANAIALGPAADEDTRSGFAKFINNEYKTEGSVLSGVAEKEGEFLGINVGGKAEGSLVHGEAGIETSAGFKFKDEDGNWNFNEFGAAVVASASGALAVGEVSGNIGYLHGKVGGELITGAVSGEAAATLFDDGKFNPSLRAKASAEASVASGSAEVGFGTDQYGVNASASGDVLHAEAEASIGVGYLGEDEKGNAMYGVGAEASAMASLAQGKISGGITLFGIDIDVSLKGYAGAAGVEAGAVVTTNGFSADAGIAALLGPGISIDVDWSDAKWIGESIDAVGEFATNTYEVASEFVSETYEAASEFVSETYDAAVDFATDTYEAAVDFATDTYEAAVDFAKSTKEAAGDFFESVGDVFSSKKFKLF